MTKIKPKDVIALVTILFIFWMKNNGADGQLDAVLALILGYYFVKRVDKIDRGE